MKTNQAVVSCLKDMIKTFGVDIFTYHSKANAIISDKMPGTDKALARKMLKLVIDHGFVTELSKTKASDINKVCNKQKRVLVDDEGIADDRAEEVIDWICQALDLKTPAFYKPTSSATNSKQQQQSTNVSGGVHTPTPTNISPDYYGININKNPKRVKMRLSRGMIALIITCISIVVVAAGVFGIVTAVQNGKINAVESLIADLPDDENYYLDYQAEIVDAYAAYMELDEKLREKVENADKLLTVMDGLKVAEAYEQRQNMQFTKLESGGYSVKLKEGASSKLSGELIIPGVYRQEPVIAIEDYAFENCRGITSVIVPNSIKTIGVGAFKGCNNLQSMILPFTGKSIDATAHEAVFGYIFGYDTQRNGDASGTNYNFKNTQYGEAAGTWQYTYVESGYNYSCYYYIPANIKTVTITDQTRIPAAVFNGCMYIESVTYEKIAEIATIEEAAFQNCLAFSKFNNVEGESLIIPSNIMEIKYKAFFKCSKFKSVVFESGIQKIDNYAFQECSSFTTLTIPNSVTNIGLGAFNGCNKLTEVSLPFTGTSATAEYENAVFGYIFGYGTERNGDASGTNHAFKNTQYGAIAGGTWQYTYIESGYNYACFYYIPQTITSVKITNQSRIPAAAFNGCSYIQKISYTKASEITTIEEAAFQNCLALKQFNNEDETVLSIPSSVVEIKYKAFYKCSNFKSVKFNEGLRQIGEYAFQECSDFTTLTIPNTVTNIGRGAFNGCNKLITLSLPFTGESATAENENAVFGYIFGYDTQRNGDASGTNRAFKNTQYGSIAGGTWQFTYIQSGYNYSCFYYIPISITSVNITNQNRIPAAAFNGCIYIESISYTKADSITTIGEAAFQNCLALESFNGAPKSVLNIPSSVTEIKYKAFYKCSMFESVNLPTGLRSIGNYAFQDCSEFTSISVPDTVTTIGVGAFNGCNKLISMSLPFVGESTTAEYEKSVFGYIFGYDTQRNGDASGTNYSFKNKKYGDIAGGTWQFTNIQSGYNYSYYYYIPSTIVSVTITNQTKVPAAAFNSCSNITQITYSKGISSQGTCAFQNCPADITE